MASGVLAADASAGNVVLDLDGTMYRGSDAVPGAADAIRRLMGHGYRVVIATNNSTRGAVEVSERARSITGLEIPPAHIVTSSMAALRILTPADDPIFVVGESGLRDTLSNGHRMLTSDPDSAGAVVVGLDRGFDYRTLAAAATAVYRGARFIATNTDATFPTPDGLEPGAGAIVAAVSRAAGSEPVIAGKPEEPMRQAITAVLEKGPTWVVGDRLETDIALGTNAGWSTVLVLTGVTDLATARASTWRPDHTLDSVADLAELILQS